jgi:hypothetical protein
MLRSSLIAAGVALVCGIASAQQQSTNIYPIKAQPKVGGVYDINSGRMIGKTSAQALGANLQTVYNNTCTWSGGAFYVGVEACEDDYDEGRVPLTANGGAGAVGPDNAIDSVQIGYCTWFPTGSVNIDMAVFDTNQLGGACVGGTPPIGQLGLLGFNSSAAGFPLPGSSVLGTQACWLVTLVTATPACLATGATTADLFNWGIRFNQQFNALSPEGPILSHNGSAGGQGTYNIAPATDVLFGNPCGDGLSNDDSFWANYDNVPVGGPASLACPTAPSAAGTGTNCYWFGGYPTNPYSGFWFVMTSRGSCTACTGNITLYCTSKTNSLGCVPAITTTGTPEMGPGQGVFNLVASQVINNKNGLWFYGTNGLAGAAFQGGHLCVKGPIKRLGVKSTGGTPPPNNCSGVLTENFNNKINGVGYPIDPALSVGAAVGAQAWSRDPASPSTTSLSGGISFTICP